jgi:hypothetical protein
MYRRSVSSELRRLYISTRPALVDEQEACTAEGFACKVVDRIRLGPFEGRYCLLPRGVSRMFVFQIRTLAERLEPAFERISQADEVPDEFHVFWSFWPI